MNLKYTIKEKEEVNKLVVYYCTSKYVSHEEFISPVFLIPDGTIGIKLVFINDTCIRILPNQTNVNEKLGE